MYTTKCGTGWLIRPTDRLTGGPPVFLHIKLERAKKRLTSSSSWGITTALFASGGQKQEETQANPMGDFVNKLATALGGCIHEQAAC